MRTTWRVEKVTATEGQTLAALVKVQWFLKNPERVAIDAEYDAFYAEHGEEATEAKYLGIEWPEEFIDCEPDDEGAEFIESVDGTRRLTLDITDGLDLAPGDNVAVTFDAMDREPVDA